MSAPAVLTSFLDFRLLDLLATGDSALHRLDARAKVLVTLVFIVCTMSFHRYAVAALIPFFVFPMAVVTAARLPIAFLLRKVGGHWQHQVVQKALDHVVVRLVINSNWTQGHAEQMRQEVQGFFEGPIRVDVEIHERLPLPPSGKFQNMVLEMTKP